MNALGAIFYREYKIRTTNLLWLFFDLLVPMLYLLVFGLGFTRALGGSFTVDGRVVSYNEFFLAGVLAMASFGVAMNASWGWFMDRDSGVFDEMLTYPITRRQHLAGKVLFSLLLSVVEAILVIAGARLLLDLGILWSRAHLVLLWTVVGTAGWFFLFSVVSIRVRRNDVYQTTINVFYFVLLFASNVFYPLEPMPAWLKGVAFANPITWQSDLLRSATVGFSSGLNLWLEAGLYVLFTVGAFALAAQALQSHE